MIHLNAEQLKHGLDFILKSPKDNGVIKLIVRRPKIGEREVLEKGEIDLEVGLVGDCWKTRGSSRTTDGFGHPDMQLNLMNTRIIDLIAQDKERYLNGRLHVVQGSAENVNAILAAFILDHIESRIKCLFGYASLTVLHRVVDELGNHEITKPRIGMEFTFFRCSASRHFFLLRAFRYFPPATNAS